MSEVLGFDQLGNQFRQLRTELENSDAVRQLRSYVAEYRPLYEEGLQNKENAAFDASVRQQLSALTAPVKHAADQLVGLATASTGASADKIITNAGNPSYASSLSLKADEASGGLLWPGRACGCAGVFPGKRDHRREHGGGSYDCDHAAVFHVCYV